MSVNVSDPHSLASAGWLEAAGPDGWPRISLSISPRQPPHSQLSEGRPQSALVRAHGRTQDLAGPLPGLPGHHAAPAQ